MSLILSFFSGITGEVIINENGDRVASYSLLDMNPKTSKFEVSGVLYFKHILKLFKFKNMFKTELQLLATFSKVYDIEYIYYVEITIVCLTILLNKYCFTYL